MKPNLLKMLSILRKKAVRHKLWFDSFNIQERLVTDLVIRNVTIVKNKILALTVSRLVVKLMAITKYAFTKRLENLGKPIVEKAATSALQIGWCNARDWLKDPLIVRWYGLQAYHSPLWRINTG